MISIYMSIYKLHEIAKKQSFKRRKILYKQSSSNVITTHTRIIPLWIVEVKTEINDTEN